MKKFLALLLLSPLAFAERNISCDTKYGDKLYKVDDIKIDVFLSYADGPMFSLDIKSETSNYLYAERVFDYENEIGSYLFFKDSNGDFLFVKSYTFSVRELLKDEYVDLRIKQTIKASEYYGKCFSI